MKKLFKTLALTLALVLPFAAMAQEETAKTTINVGGDADSPNIAWTVTAEEEGDGIFVVTFDGAIKEGYHGYAMMDFSAPIFDFEGVEVVGDVVETLTPEEHGIDEITGMPSLIYEHQAIYVHKIKAQAGQNVSGYVNATICTNETNQCTANIVEFTITMPGVAAAAGEETPADNFNWDEFWSAILQAIAWGFVALVTPCVFPMVPMTVSFFVKGSQTPAQGRFRAMMYGFFIVALYVLPIALLVLLSNAFGTNAAGDVFNFISTHWIPNLIFFLIFMIFAASFFGAFEITMPSKLVNKSDAVCRATPPCGFPAPTTLPSPLRLRSWRLCARKV